VALFGGVDLDLAQVRAFVAVVDHGHFGRAARTLALSQQALSKRVARLEDRLGPLLERRRGGVVLTGAGRRFLPAARQLLEIADHAFADVRQAPVAPVRVDVWSEVQTPAEAMRAVAREQPGIIVELSMRRDLAEAMGALQRHELDLAFGNVTALARPLPPDLTAELVFTDTIAALVSARSDLATRDHLTTEDLARHGIWWPIAGSSEELRAFVEEYARSIGAPLVTDGTNLGLDEAVKRVAGDPALIAPVVATWPLAGRAGVRLIPLRPAPRYPWYAVWRTASAHPSLPPVLRALRTARAHNPAAQ
jgi:DNA-binding transcriptional LysR family regulator